MLEITVPGGEFFNERTNEFLYTKESTLILEHSLASISRWEAKYKKPFFSVGNKPKKRSEAIEYIKCMTLNEVDPLVYMSITNDIIKQVDNYINDPMTATTVNLGSNNKKSNRIITSEVIYFQMTAFNIPFECDKWHLNRLLMLIQVCSAENQPKKNMSSSQIAKQNRQLNAARCRARHTRG